MVKIYKTVYLERDGEEFELEVEAEMSPFIPARGPSWDSPGEPAEGGEIEVLSVKYQGNEVATLTEAEEAFILNYLYENLTGDEFDDDPDY
jgi:hypothetical protein